MPTMDLSERIAAFNQSRLSEMVILKYKNMRANAFGFFRGTCHLFYEDLKNAGHLPPSPAGWICGDLHLENFGSFKSDNRLVYFDLNDFDEAILAPVAWDVVRLTTSIFVAFDSLGIDPGKSDKMAMLYLKRYAQALINGKPNYIEPNISEGIVKELLVDAMRQKIKAILLKRTFKKNHRLKIQLRHPRHRKLDKQEKQSLLTYMEQWLKNDGDSPYNYEALDVIFRIAGTGSLGLKRFMFLLKSSNDAGEPYILLDMKQTVNSSLSAFTDIKQPSWPSEAVRVKEIQQRMQNRPPALLSTGIYKGEHYVMQEMQPEKDSIDFRDLKERYRDMCGVIGDMGMLTASAQLRSSGRQGSATADELIAFGQDLSWIDAAMTYAKHYAAVVKANYASFTEETNWLQDHETKARRISLNYESPDPVKNQTQIATIQ